MKMPRLLGGAAASAFLLALGLPNEAFLYGQPVLGAVALIPLYLVLLETSSWRATFIAAGFFGALAHGFSSYWLYFFHGFAFWTLGSSTIAYFFVYGVYGLYLGLFLKGAGVLRPLAFALGWIVLEYAKSTGFLGYPWGLLAYTQTQVLPMLQVADLCGVYGPSLILALLNGGLAETYWALRAGKTGADRGLSLLVPTRRKGYRLILPQASAPGLSPALASLGLALILLGANLGYGAWSLAEARPERGRLQALLVQQNLDPWEAGEEEGLRINIDLARAEIARAGRRPDIVLFSESTLSRPYEDFPAWFASHPRGGALIPFIQENGAWLFTGAPIVVNWEKEEISNSVILIDPQGRQTGDYAKVHPVPFAESIPFWDFAPFRSFIQNVVGLESGWTMGKEFKVFTLPLPSGKLRFGAPICFEDAFPDVCRAFFLQDVDLLINLTNDSWSKTKSSEIQHLAAARFRAIEARLALVRSTNGGVSGVIDARGRIIEDLPLFVAGARIREVPIYQGRGQTYYVRHGDWLVLGAIALSIGLALYLGLGPGPGRKRRP